MASPPLPAAAGILRRFGPLWPWLGLCLSLLATVGVWLGVRSVERTRLTALKHAQASTLVQRVEHRITSLEQALRGAAGYLGRGPLPTRAEWHDYVEGLDLPGAYPGVQGLSFVEWIPHADLPAHIQRVRREGFPEYAVVPGGTADPLPEGASSILYLEPMRGQNILAFGRDMLQDQTRREPMLQARDSGQVITSPPLTLYQDGDGGHMTGVVLYCPVYRQGQPLGTVLERRQALRGWATIPIRLADFMRAILPEDEDLPEIHLTDGAAGASGTLLYDSEPSAPVAEGAERWRLVVPGRIWDVSIESSASFNRQVGHAHHLQFLAGGVIISLLLFTILTLGTRAEGRAQRLAHLRGEELLATEARFRALFEKAPFGMAIVDSTSGRILSANEALGRVLGYSPAELLVRDFQSMTHPDHLQGDLASVKELAAGVVPVVHKEKRYLHRDGHEVWARLSMVRLPTSAEEPGRHLSLVEDITEARQRQEALRASEARFRSLFELLPVGVTLTDDQGRIMASNPTSEAILGIPSDDLLRRDFKGPYWDILRPDGSLMPPGEYASVRALAEDRRVEDVEMGVRRPDGRVCWILVTAEPIRVPGMGVLIVYRDISAQRAFEQMLVASEASLALAQEIGDFGSWNLMMDDGVQRWAVSDGLRRIYGYGPDQPITLETGFEAMHPEDREPVQAAWERAMAGAGPCEWEHRILVRGEVRWLSVRVVFHRTSEGLLREASGIVQDVTRQKAADEALRASESRLRILGDQLPDSFLYQFLSKPGETPRFLYLSAGVEHLCGVRAEAVVRDPGLLFGQVDPAMMPAYLEAEAASARDLAPFAMDLRQRHADGRWRWFRVRSKPRPQADGSVLWEGISTDVTELQESRVRLEESEAQFRAMVDCAADAIYLHDGQGRFLMVNEAACRMTGYSQEELLSLPLRELDPDFLESRDVQIWNSMSREGQVSMESRHRRKDGSLFPVEVHLGLLREEPERLYLAMVRDQSVRERVRATELRARKAESLVLMAGSIAHDFNNIFQGVLGFLEVAGLRAGENPGVHLALDKADSSLRRAITLSWKMLDFSGRALVNLELMDPEAWLAGEVQALVSEGAATHLIDFAREPVPLMRGDRTRLHEVLVALVANACEAMGTGGGRIQVRLYPNFGVDRPRSEVPDLWPLERPAAPATICLEVADDGPGVPPEILDRICDPFFSTRALGRGLGLASVVGILRAHHAGLHLFNGEHGGLVVRMHFPPAGA